MSSEELKWYEVNNCTHAHCPFNDEHPQPFMYNGNLYCGKCWYDNKELTLMVPCTPETCDE